MHLKTAPCLVMAMGMLIAPGAAFGKTIPNPVANSGLHGNRITPHPVANSGLHGTRIHPNPVPNSRRTSQT